ncbi:nucleotidyltransferase family protein [Aliarcobacter butzleri]|uniref:nucleotidyltransferase family protein n=1 Tax=Aliarcobacter butzleri TaxID=28197 RepID=UPI00125F18CC|nr:nucleotidyltransferase family protein [Aliarcobacter butzleri]
MNKDYILQKLSQKKEYIQNKYEVDKIGLFGSYAKGTQTEDSDIDIYVEFKHKTFDNLAGLWNYLEELYNKKIDLFHKHKNNNKVIISNIQKDVIYG